jgi:RNA polymerase sigma-70 factor (ECF subfamily)
VSGLASEQGRHGALAEGMGLDRSVLNEISPAVSATVATAVDRQDVSLVLALRAGESWASEALWERYSRRVSGFFARVAGASLQDVEDLTQDVFLRVLANHGNIQKPASLRHYVMSIAYHVLNLQFRYQRVRRLVVLSATGETPDMATPARADDDARHALRACHEILEGIRARERVAFLLHHVEGLTLAEVALRLNTSRSTAKRLVSRAARKVSLRARRLNTR